MNIGINVLNVALSLIGTQEVQWEKYLSRVQNERGQWVSSYEDPVFVKCSWQPIQSDIAKELGLDTAKRYHTLHVSESVSGVERMASPDIITTAYGARHEVVGVADWTVQNGWRALVCVEAALT